VKRVSRFSLVVGLLVCSVLLLAAVSACGSGETLTLQGTKWIMTTYAVQGAMNTALTAPQVDATFAAPSNGTGQVAGSGGINQYTGSYTVDGSKLTVGSVTSTRLAGEQAAMQQETAYLANLQSAASYKIDGSKLSIMNPSGTTVLTYEAAT
jgi:heat shock protein HslJ